jgi:glucose-6-phosphate 1-dehydrogenase
VTEVTPAMDESIQAAETLVEAMLPGAAYINPLRDPRDRRLPRVPEPCALVVFGVTGDLSRKKLLPAIYDLANRGLLPTDFVLLGFARRDWGDGEFESVAKKAAKEYARTPWSEEVWKRLSGNIKFVAGSFDDDAAFDELCVTLDELRISHGIKGNAAFYLSIPPSRPGERTQAERPGRFGLHPR